MLTRKPFALTPIMPLSIFQAGQYPHVELTIDQEYLDFVIHLPYIANMFHTGLRDCYQIVFDARYDIHAAWHELNRELTAETRLIELNPAIW